jgi:hypothetical protein
MTGGYVSLRGYIVMNHSTTRPRSYVDVEIKKGERFRVIYGKPDSEVLVVARPEMGETGTFCMGFQPQYLSVAQERNPDIAEITRVLWVSKDNYDRIIANDYNCKYNCNTCKGICDFWEAG